MDIPKLMEAASLLVPEEGATENDITMLWVECMPFLEPGGRASVRLAPLPLSSGSTLSPAK